jgi:hypothetical protein
MSDFAYSLAIKGPLDKLKGFYPKLEALGYEVTKRQHPYHTHLITGYTNVNGRCQTNNGSSVSTHPDRTELSADQEPLIMALAAMHKDRQTHVGEIWRFNEGDFYEIVSLAPEWNLRHLTTSGNVASYQADIAQISLFRKATKEEIIGFFTKNKESENLKQQEMSENKKLLGYKVDRDYYTGKIKKGTVILTSALEEDGEYLIQSEDDVNFYFPAEIVESWEKVYESDFKVGDWVVVLEGHDEDDIKVGEVGEIDHVATDGDLSVTNQEGDWDWVEPKYLRLATPKEIENAKRLKVGEHAVVISDDRKSVKVGCQTFTKVQLEALRDLFNRDITVEVTLGGYEIELDIVKQTLDKMK